MREREAASADATVFQISPEMTLLLGAGPWPDAPMPAEPLALVFVLGRNDDPPAVRIETISVAKCGASVVIAIAKAGLDRVGGSSLAANEQRAFHLPRDLRTIVFAICDSSLDGETRRIYRAAKSIELLCETIRLQTAGDLVPLCADGALSLEDSRRLIAARQLIDERWPEKLTLDKIARACGLNRAKLTRGFREMFNCTIAEAIAERRLNHASLMLRTTNLSISSIGYENGYLNNASFTRAFGRRFGVSPSDFRACQTVAA